MPFKKGCGGDFVKPASGSIHCSTASKNAEASGISSAHVRHRTRPEAVHVEPVEPVEPVGTWGLNQLTSNPRFSLAGDVSLQMVDEW